MNALLSIELEILEPALVDSAERLLQLHPSQIRWVSIRLAADEGSEESVAFEAKADDSRAAVRSLIALAQRAQPNGTPVKVWYQGRIEQFLV